MMRFIPTSVRDLQETAKIVRTNYADGYDVDCWESWYVIKTKNDMALSRPQYVESLGVFFQPRAGTGSPVITLGEVVEIHRVDEPSR
jgi:hypothetical protein